MSVLCLTAHDPSRKKYWNRRILDGCVRNGIRIVFASWTEDPTKLIRLSSSCTHVCLLTAAYYVTDYTSFDKVLSKTIPEMQHGSPALRICNSRDLTRWNSNKTYLADLESEGFLMPQTKVLLYEMSVGSVWSEIQSLSLASRGCPVVVKPSVGASGQGVHKINQLSSLSESDKAILEQLAAKSNANNRIILQEFVPEIVSNGELSLVYVSERLIGAVRKSPVKEREEFRINSAYGGTTSRIDDSDIPPAAKLVGSKVLDWLNARFGQDCCAYMRLDGIMVNRPEPAFMLMEVECIEPALFDSDETMRTRLIEAFTHLFTLEPANAEVSPNPDHDVR